MSPGDLDANRILDELRDECRYSPEPDEDDPELGSVDSLIGYKDALEDKVAELVGHLNEMSSHRRRLLGAVMYALGMDRNARKRCRVYTKPGSVVRELRRAQAWKEKR